MLNDFQCSAIGVFILIAIWISIKYYYNRQQHNKKNKYIVQHSIIQV
jgi:hypothetical protein